MISCHCSLLQLPLFPAGVATTAVCGRTVSILRCQIINRVRRRLMQELIRAQHCRSGFVRGFHTRKLDEPCVCMIPRSSLFIQVNSEHFYGSLEANAMIFFFKFFFIVIMDIGLDEFIYHYSFDYRSEATMSNFRECYKFIPSSVQSIQLHDCIE